MVSVNAFAFLKECSRMCNSYDGCTCECALNSGGYGKYKDCKLCNIIGGDTGYYTDKDIHNLVNTVMTWAAENPEETLLTDFVARHPFAKLDDRGIPEDGVCPFKLGYEMEEPYYLCMRHGSISSDRDRCVECWNRSLKEVQNRNSCTEGNPDSSEDIEKVFKVDPAATFVTNLINTMKDDHEKAAAEKDE